jgi:hypothetical protein
MTGRTLFMVIEEHANSKEANEVFRRRGWTPVDDRSAPLPGKRQVRKIEHDTPQIKLQIEEWEYGGDEK